MVNVVVLGVVNVVVMGMHYEQEMNLREIGEVLGVSESRVCQLHTQAMARLRSRLRNL